MGPKIWDFVKHYFKPTGGADNFGKPGRISGFTLFLLWVIRFETGWPFKVTHGVKTGGHSEGSQHYEATATDGYFKTDVSYYEQILRVEQILKDWQLFDFVGLGIYPDWNTPGFHFDARGRRARWGYVNKLVGGKIKAVMVGYDVAKNKAKEAANE